MTKGNEPVTPVESIHNHSNGLTKREYFAAMAMQGYLSADPANEKTTVISTASWAVDVADALITALNEKEVTNA